MSAFFAGLNTFVIGILIVFLALVLLIVLINVFGKVVSNFENKKKAIEPTPAQAAKTRVAAVTTQQPVVTVEDDCEIVAAISAVIALSLGTTTDKLVVKSLKRIR